MWILRLQMVCLRLLICLSRFNSWRRLSTDAIQHFVFSLYKLIMLKQFFVLLKMANVSQCRHVIFWVKNDMANSITSLNLFSLVS